MINVVTMAQRIKELRENRGLSHSVLANELKAECGLNISDKQLMNYESAAKGEFHSKAQTVVGMSAKTLAALSEYFGVSADYILGKTEHKTPDCTIKAILDYTGLSEKALEELHRCNSVSFDNALDGILFNLTSLKPEDDYICVDAYLIPVLNLILENDAVYCEFFKHLINYLYSDGICFGVNMKIEDALLDEDNKYQFTKTIVLKNNSTPFKSMPWYAGSNETSAIALMLLIQSLNSIKNSITQKEKRP